MYLFRHTLLFIITLLWLSVSTQAQQLLNKPLSIDVQKQGIVDVLTILSNKGNFNFSYNSKIINKDTLITLSAKDKPLVRILETMFSDGYEFKESGNYIIIRRKPITTSNIIAKSPSKTDYFIIDGFVVDEETGERIPYASIYDKTNLVSTLSDERGYFVLKLKNKLNTSEISISKQNYQDTSIKISVGLNQQVSFALARKSIQSKRSEPLAVQRIIGDSTECAEEIASDNESKKQHYLNRLFLSSKRRIQNINMSNFIANRSFQLSVIPMISTRGNMNHQIVSRTSINLLGGYCAGVNWLEIGGLFNIDKKNVQYLQLGGLFNLVGGDVKGTQVGGLYNQVLGNVDGVQVAGLVNITDQTVDGVQIASLVNSSKKVKGLQIGLVNIAQNFDGYGIGLINIVSTPNKKRVYFVFRWPKKKWITV